MTVKKALLALAMLILGAHAVWAASAMDKDTLIVGTESTYPPYEFIGLDGTLQGFDIEMVNRIGEILGKKIQWVDMAFDALIPSILSGRIDMASAGMSATAERMERVAFSIPYEISMSAFVALPENPISSLDDLAGKTVAVQLGTVQETFARDSIKNADVKSFQKFDDCVREVVLGRAFAALMDIPVARQFVTQKDFAGKVVVAYEQEITETGKANAMSLKDPELKAAVDGALMQMEADGELQELRKKWFDE